MLELPVEEAAEEAEISAGDAEAEMLLPTNFGPFNLHLFSPNRQER